jgi:hypothetical protein
MAVLYRFITQGTCPKCGKPGQRRGGMVYGQYTLLAALLWAIEDFCTPGREPFLIVADGAIIFDAARARAAAGVDEPGWRGECRCLGSPFARELVIESERTP